MAITIPTVASVAQSTFGGYIYNQSNSDIQALFNNDTNWTASDWKLFYKNVPVLTMFRANNNNFTCRLSKYTAENQLTAKPTGFDIGSTIYIYDFDTFTVFSGLQYTDFINASFNNTTETAIIVLDKTNLEVVEAWVNNSYAVGVGGGAISLDENQEVVYSELAIKDYGGYSNFRHEYVPVVREYGLSDSTYFKEYDMNGKEMTRFVFLKKFPELSVFETLHIGDKYIFVMPYAERTHTIPWGSPAHELWCAIGIDVTDEIN